MEKIKEELYCHKNNLAHMYLLSKGIGFEKVIETAVDFYKEGIEEKLKDYIERIQE